jgi:CelD/BcsL family acetyltransferase involved in cellulose biosynthesis
VQTRLVKVKDLSRSDEAAWRDLADRAVEPNPFFEPDFVVPSCRHIAGVADATVVIAHEGSSFRGLFPIACIERARSLPVRSGRTRGLWTGAGLDTPLLDPTRMEAATDALLRCFSGSDRPSGWPGVIVFHRLVSGGPVAECLRRTCEVRGYPTYVPDTWVRGMVSRKQGWHDPAKPRHRREIERLRRRLAQQFGAEVTLEERSQHRGAVDEFLKMEAAGWKSEYFGGDISAFSYRSDTNAFFHEFHERWRSTGRLIQLSLNLAEQPIAMQCYLQAGNGVICYRIAYDENFAQYSPGSMLFTEAMSYFRDRTDVEWLDSGTSKDNQFFLRLLPERRTISSLMVGAGGLASKAWVRARGPASRLEAARRRLREKRERAPEDEGQA